MKNFDCDPKWPVCLYDFSFRAKIPSSLTLKATHRLKNFVIDDHFYPPNYKMETREQKLDMQK